ncbi:response regulator [Candidatus Kaiserbacteria bacterium]|nr:response regulator [Candidatus Kaiserbacteria bacterium]
MADGSKVLIIEDELSLIEALRDALTRRGIAVISAEDGERGLAAAKEHEPDLILLDIVMPKMDGLAMLKALRESTWGKNMPVIILTNLSADSSDRVRALIEYTPLLYLVKSDWNLHDIVAKVEAALTQE